MLARNLSVFSKPITLKSDCAPAVFQNISPGRAEQAEAFQQRLVGLAVGGDVGLQQHHVRQARLHPGSLKVKRFHFLA